MSKTKPLANHKLEIALSKRNSFN